MSGNHFVFNFSWDYRERTPAEIGELILRSAEALGKIHPSLENWWFMDLVAHEFLPMDQARTKMATLVEQGLSTGEDGESSPRDGYFSTLTTDNERAEKVNLQIHDGFQSHKEFFWNSGTFVTERSRAPDPTFINGAVFEAAMMAMVRIWGAASARAFSGDLSKVPETSQRLFPPAWMTYLSAPLLARITPPTSVLSKPTSEGGLLMIATEETFDVANAQHMAAAWAISDALLPLTRKEFLF